MDELAEIRGELVALRASNLALQRQVDLLSVAVEDAAPVPGVSVSRRLMLSGAAAVAVGVVTGAAISTRPAYANVTAPLTAGEINTTLAQTTLLYGSPTGHTQTGAQDLTVADAMLQIDNGASPLATSIGILANGRGKGLRATASGTGGIAVDATGAGSSSTGVAASGSNVAVNAVSTNFGVSARGDVIGIRTSGARPLAFFGGHEGHGIPTDASFNGQFAQDLDNNIYYCVVAGTPGTYRRLAGPTTAGSLHLLPTPTRVFDSRSAHDPPWGGPTGILEGGPDAVPVVIDCKANSSGVPADATGVIFNLTIALTVGSGFLSVWGQGPRPLASSINWATSGSILSNSVTTACGAGAMIRIVCGGGGNTHLLVDIGGYYR